MGLSAFRRCGQDCRLHAPGNNVSEVCNLSSPHLCACHRDESSAASAAREALFQPKDLVWLDP
ncbi:hypothetical protein CN170_24660, partial [Sinorhizobium meliloti]